MASKISVRGIGSVALERATFQHRTVHRHCGHGADFGHDADEWRLPGRIAPDALPLTGALSRPHATGPSSPMPPQGVNGDAAQVRAIRQSSGARRAALDLQTRAADPHGDCRLAIWTAGAGQKSAALGYRQALEVPVQRTIVGGIRAAVVPAP